MKNKARIYLDNNATTFLDPRIALFLSDFLKNPHGNPSSLHAFGQEARSLLDSSRRAIAAFFKVQPHEVLFTSSGSEAMNLLIRGFLEEKGEIITSNIEHSCVKLTLKQLKHQGFKIIELPAGLMGAVDPIQLKASINNETKLIVLMGANNETGVKNNLKEIALYSKQAGVPLVVDGVAMLGKDSLEMFPGITGMALSGHKIHALQGVGAAIVRSKKLKPVIYGSQEYGFRGGTENLIGIASFAEAIKLLTDFASIAKLRDDFESEIKSKIANVETNGLGQRVSNTCNLSFEGVDGESLLIALDQAGIAASHGSACSAGALEPSPVLLNMGIPLPLVRSSIRFSLSRFTTIAEIDETIGTLQAIVAKLRK